MNNSKNETFTSLFEGLLKSPLTLIERISQNEKPGTLIAKLLLIALTGFLIFGITLGSFSLHHQLWAAPLKTFLGITFSTLICLPSLYIFTALTGTNLGIKEIAQGMAGALALIAALLLGFTPVLWVFSQSTDSETFFGSLVLATWLIALFFGTGFLLKLVTKSGTIKTTPIKIWIGIFLLVTLQMSTTLRPIIGTSPELFPAAKEKLFFLEHWTSSFTSSVDNFPEETQAPATEPKESPSPPQGASKTNPFLDE